VGEGFRARRVAVISGSHLVHDLYGAFLSPLLPVLIERHGLSLRLAGTLLPAFRAPSFIQPSLGYLADRGRIIRLLPLFMLVSALCMSSLLVARSYLQAAALLVAGGFSVTLFHAVALALISGASGGRHGTGMSLFMLGGEMARSLGPLYIVTLAGVLPRSWTPAAALPGAAAAVVLAVTGAAGRVSGRKTSPPSFFQGLGRGGRDLAFILIIGAVQSFTLHGFTLFLPTFLRQEGATLFTAGSALTILQLAGAAGALTGGTLSDRVGRKTFFMIAVFAVPLLLNGFLLSGGYLPRALFLVGTGLFLFGSTPVRYAYAQELVPGMGGTVSSLLMTLNLLVSILASMTTGLLGDHLGLHAAFRLISLLPLAAVPLIALLGRGEG